MLWADRLGGVWFMGMDSMDDKQLHIGGHEQVNVTWGLVVHVELITLDH